MRVKDKDLLSSFVSAADTPHQQTTQSDTGLQIPQIKPDRYPLSRLLSQLLK